MIKKYISIILQSAACAVLVALAACQADIVDPSVKGKNAIIFGASLEEMSKIKTRSDLDSSYITVDPYNMDFYIQLNCPDSEVSGGTYSEIGRYVIPSGFEGRLEAPENEEPLDWHNLTSPHTFYSWNMPFIENYQASADTLGVVFYNSAEYDGFEEHANNSVYETFIGAKTPSYSYDRHGKYVDLTYHHLVSKILIGSFRLIQSDGVIQENLKADVTFVNMPKRATFYPHPSAAYPESGAPADSRPYVGKPWVQSPDDGVTYFIDNSPTTQDWFYICPEIDFSEVDFKIKLNSIKYAGFDTYYGTFDDVVFERTPGSKYDNENGTDSKILHAGEMMTLNITLIPGIGPGLRIVIDDWSTDDPKDAQYFSHQGVYSDADVNEIINSFAQEKTYYPDGDDPEAEKLWDIYGEEGDNGEKYFPLYDNVQTGSNIFPVPRGYTIDGQGHTLYMKENYGAYFPSGTPYFNIGSCVDLYIKDQNGNNAIYIDRDGYVWIWDKDNFTYKKTEYFLEPLDGDYKSYDISAQTGEVHRSTYYNNSITGS